MQKEGHTRVWDTGRQPPTCQERSLGRSPPCDALSSAPSAGGGSHWWPSQTNTLVKPRILIFNFQFISL